MICDFSEIIAYLEPAMNAKYSLKHDKNRSQPRLFYVMLTYASSSTGTKGNEWRFGVLSSKTLGIPPVGVGVYVGILMNEMIRHHDYRSHWYHLTICNESLSLCLHTFHDPNKLAILCLYVLVKLNSSVASLNMSGDNVNFRSVSFIHCSKYFILFKSSICISSLDLHRPPPNTLTISW